MKVASTAVFVFILALAAAPAAADRFIGGSSTAEPNPDEPSWGEWKYTIEISWDNSEAGHGLSHLDVLFGFESQVCCDENFYTFPETVGSSDGEPDGCVVNYYAELNCSGDPSIEGDEGALIMFQPYESEDCEPGVTGTGAFVFYSDFGPLPVDEPNERLIFKAAGDACYGSLGGELPLDCETVAAGLLHWGTVKTQF